MFPVVGGGRAPCRGNEIPVLGSKFPVLGEEFPVLGDEFPVLGKSKSEMHLSLRGKERIELELVKN